MVERYQAKHVVAPTDVDGDGQINYEEFVKVRLRMLQEHKT